MHPDSQTRELRVGGWLPGQRGDSDHADPSWALSQETMLLPAFLTGTPAEAVKAADAVVGEPAKSAEAVDDPDKLPPSERNMLIFVALLLATGTLAILAMATV